MKAIAGTWKNGHIILDAVTDWPEGCRVLVEPLLQTDKLGLTELEVLATPEAIADWLQWFDAFEAVKLTPEDQAASTWP